MSGTRGRLLVVEDSLESAELLATIVEEEGFTPVISATGTEAMRIFDTDRPVAVLLDWVMPDRPGIDVCRHVRESDALVPVVFVSGRDDEASVARGLDAGADDFIVKPVRPIELVARLEAHLRKTEAGRAAGTPAGPAEPPPATLRLGAVEVDTRARVVWVDGHELSLGPLEFRLLEYFGRNAGIAISREQVLNQVYGYEADISTERVDLLVRRLRGKLGEGPLRGAQLVAVPGYGYRLERRRPPAQLKGGPPGPKL